MVTTGFVHGGDAKSYDLGDDHPLSPLRRELAGELIRAYGLLERPGVEVITPRMATDEEIARVHAPAYIAAVRRYGADPTLSASWEAG